MDKLAKYKAGHYSCEVPPVCTMQWDTDAWIRWIDSHGFWFA